MVDQRDGSRDLMDHLDPDESALTLLNFEIDGKEVACGDAMLIGNGPRGTSLSIGVELKQMSDLLSSISTGRLGGTQIPRMLKIYDALFILTYGEYRTGPSNHLQVRKWKRGKPSWQNFRIGRQPVPISYLDGFMLTAQLKATLECKPLFHKHVHDIREAAVWLQVLNHWLAKPWDKHRGLSVFDRSREISAPPDADPVEVQIAKTASSLPAIDWVRGFAIASHFDSVEDMVLADKAEWQKVHGIGPVIAKEAFNAIRRRKNRPR